MAAICDLASSIPGSYMRADVSTGMPRSGVVLHGKDQGVEVCRSGERRRSERRWRRLLNWKRWSSTSLQICENGRPSWRSAWLPPPPRLTGNMQYMCSTCSTHVCMQHRVPVCAVHVPVHAVHTIHGCTLQGLTCPGSAGRTDHKGCRCAWGKPWMCVGLHDLLCGSFDM